jgi:pyruvate/2-oxoglutarate dehydrogenase complex dihydrolipoamide acyltransferase (E2) component
MMSQVQAYCSLNCSLIFVFVDEEGDEADHAADEELTAAQLKEQVQEEIPHNIAAEAETAAQQLEALEEEMQQEQQEAAEEAARIENADSQYSIDTQEALDECLQTFMVHDMFLDAADPGQISVKAIAQYIASLCGIDALSLKAWVKQHHQRIGVAFLSKMQGQDAAEKKDAEAAEKKDEEDCVMMYDDGETHSKKLPKRLQEDDTWVKVDPGDEAKLMANMWGNILMDVFDHFRKVSATAYILSAA